MKCGFKRIIKHKRDSASAWQFSVIGIANGENENSFGARAHLIYLKFLAFPFFCRSKPFSWDDKRSLGHSLNRKKLFVTALDQVVFEKL